MGSRPSRNNKAREWSDAHNNEFYFSMGKTASGGITFQVKRRRGAPALSFSIGERLFLTHNRNYYTAEVVSFEPHNRCGSVIAASGLICITYQEDIAEAVDSSNMRAQNASKSHIFYDA